MKSFFQTTWLKPALFLILGLCIGWLIFGGSSHQPDEHAGHNHSESETIWTCSMHPSVRDDEPGTCPICAMDLIPLSSTEAEDDNYSLSMTNAAIKLADIQTVAVRKETPEITLWAPGTVSVDERKINNISSHYSGRITELYVNFTGQFVERGKPLAQVYSDDLLISQRELIEAYNRRSQNPALYRAARQKMLFWNVTESQVDAIIANGEPFQYLDILAPESGYVMMREVSKGDYFNTGKSLFQIADLDVLWMNLDVFETDISLISVGQTFSVQAKSHPEKTFNATISWIDPILNSQNRTVRVRADVTNSNGLLKPGMLLQGNIDISLNEEKVLAPVSSILWTGPRSIVYVLDSESDTPRFESREVTLGRKAGDFYVIEEGLEEGEEVVFNGAFTIDSEMQLADKFSMMNRQPGTGAMPAGHQHNGHAEQTEIIDMSDDVSDAFRKEFTGFIQLYLDLKDALIASDFELTKTHASALLSSIETIGEHRNQGEAHVAWMEHYTNLMGHLRPLTQAGDIEELRKEFRFLSDLLVLAVKQFGIEGVVYQQFCPMAFDDEGAFWLSSEEEIANPYLPETMLRCGEVIEEISF